MIIKVLILHCVFKIYVSKQFCSHSRLVSVSLMHFSRVFFSDILYLAGAKQPILVEESGGKITSPDIILHDPPFELDFGETKGGVMQLFGTGPQNPPILMVFYP